MDTAVPKYLRIERDLREAMLDGSLRPGSRLPTETALAARYKVSRVTLRKALAILSSDGRICQIPGRGTFVASPEDGDPYRIRKQRSHLRRMNRGVAVIVPNVTMSLFAGIIRGAEDVCREQGYHVLLGNSDGSPEKEAEYMAVFAQRGVSGMIIAPNYNSYRNPWYASLRERGIPFVLTDVSVKGIDADLVATDNVQGACLGTARLIADGCRRIAFVSGWKSSSSSRERLAGYLEALAEAKLPFDGDLVREGDFSREFGCRAWKELSADRGVDGILSANEPITLGMLAASRENGRRAGSEVRIAAFDEPDLPLEIERSIVIIRQPRHEIGRTAARMVLERMRGRGEPPACRKVLLNAVLSDAGFPVPAAAAVHTGG